MIFSDWERKSCSFRGRFRMTVLVWLLLKGHVFILQFSIFLACTLRNGSYDYLGKRPK